MTSVFTLSKKTTSANSPESKRAADRRNAPHNKSDDNDTRSNDSSESKLHDIEEQLGITETRCNTLKEQLSNMKKYCIDVRGIDDDAVQLKGKFNNQYRHHNDNRMPYTVINDGTDPNVRTINNILTGLSNSVNRLSAIHTNIDSQQSVIYQSTAKKDVKEIACGEDAPTESSLISKKRQRANKQAKIVKTTSGGFPKSHSQEKSGGRHEKRAASSTTTHRRVRIVKRYKNNRYKIRSKEYEDAQPSCIVELYHNNKVAECRSDSDETASQRNKPIVKYSGIEEIDTDCIQLMTTTDRIVTHESPLQTIDSCADRRAMERQSDVTPFKRRLSRIGETPSFDNRSMTRNYELPTIASKLKQVAKGYMRGFDFRTIPFCAARSTSPSHNIGINIQQVMSIIKTRQPLNGISPTLAHNIGIAAERLQNNPLSAIVTTLGSRLGIKHGQSMCPLSRYHSYNYHQMQDVAREIPEESYPVEGDNNEPVGNRHDGTDIKGACGDTEAQRFSAVWTVDPTNRQNCTCVPSDGLHFEQVYSKYAAPGREQQGISPSNYGRFRQYRANRFKRTRYPFRFGRSRTDLGASPPLRGKERSLKEVLENLHKEFEQMNNKYESLSKQVNTGMIDKSNEVMSELEKLETDLNKKENEINMVMDLYKEVTVLKEQVKTLKEKASTGSVAGSITTPVQASHPQIRSNRDREQNTVLHLTKLLRQIQEYQGLYK